MKRSVMKTLVLFVSLVLVGSFVCSGVALAEPSKGYTISVASDVPARTVVQQAEEYILLEDEAVPLASGEDLGGSSYAPGFIFFIAAAAVFAVACILLVITLIVRRNNRKFGEEVLGIRR